jgi:hypothetical protein
MCVCLWPVRVQRCLSSWLPLRLREPTCPLSHLRAQSSGLELGDRTHHGPPPLPAAVPPAAAVAPPAALLPGRGSGGVSLDRRRADAAAAGEPEADKEEGDRGGEGEVGGQEEIGPALQKGRGKGPEAGGQGGGVLVLFDCGRLGEIRGLLCSVKRSTSGLALLDPPHTILPL